MCWTVRTLLSATCCLPIGSLIYLLFCVTKWGWGFEKYCEEANTGNGIKICKEIKTIFPVYSSDIDSVYFDSGINLKIVEIYENRKIGNTKKRIG